jgi:hypothetical protein
MWPRCCSRAFIGTTKKPAQRADQDQQRHGQPGVLDEVHRQHDEAHGNAQRNHAHRPRRVIMRAAPTAPSATPIATTPCSMLDFDRSN